MDRLPCRRIMEPDTQRQGIDISVALPCSAGAALGRPGAGGGNRLWVW